MKTNKVLGVLSGAAALATSGMILGLSNPASAAVLWDWSYSGSGPSGSGTFTTTDVRPDGSYLIEGITGTINDSRSNDGPQTITSLLAPGSFQGNDNVLRATVPQLTFTGGVGFISTDFDFIPPLNSQGLLYYDPGSFRPAGYYAIAFGTASAVSFTATARITPPTTVPEPSSILGFITLGSLMLGSAVRKARV